MKITSAREEIQYPIRQLAGGTPVNYQGYLCIVADPLSGIIVRLDNGALNRLSDDTPVTIADAHIVVGNP